MDFELPELIQRARLDVSGWTSGVSSLVNEVKRFQVALDNTGMDTVEKSYERALTKLTDLANAMNNFGSTARQNVQNVTEEFRKMQAVMADPKMRADFANLMPMGVGGQVTPDRVMIGVDLAYAERQKRLDAVWGSSSPVQFDPSRMSPLNPDFDLQAKEMAQAKEAMAQYRASLPSKMGADVSQKAFLAGLGGPDSVGANADQLKYLRDLAGPGSVGADADQLRFLNGGFSPEDLKSRARQADADFRKNMASVMGPGSVGADASQMSALRAEVLRNRGVDPKLRDALFPPEQEAKKQLEEMQQAKQLMAKYRQSLPEVKNASTLPRARLVKDMVGGTDYDPNARMLLGAFFGHNAGGVVAGLTGIGPPAMAAVGAIYGLSKAFQVAKETAFDFVGVLGNFVQEGMKVEKTLSRLTVLSGGSSESGKGLLSGFFGLSATTPFSMNQLSQTGEILLGMGIPATDLVGTLTTLGEVATGDADKLRRLALVYGEIMAEGRITGFRIRQLATQGIGIGDFAKTLGVSGSLTRSLMSGGFVDKNIMYDVMKDLTGPGGRFHDNNEKYMETASGQWDRIGNLVEQMMGRVGAAFLGNSELSKFLKSLGDALVALTPAVEAAAKIFGGALKDSIEGLASWMDKFVARIKEGPGGPGGGNLPAGLAAGSAVARALFGNAGSAGLNLMEGMGDTTSTPMKLLSLFNPLAFMATAVAGKSVTAPAAKGIRDVMQFIKDTNAMPVPEKVKEEKIGMARPYPTIHRETEESIQGLIQRMGLDFGDPNKKNVLGTGITPLEQFQSKMKQAYEMYWGADLGPDFRGPQFPKGSFAQKPEHLRQFMFESYEALRQQSTGGRAESDRLPQLAYAQSQAAQEIVNKAQVDQKSVLEEMLQALTVASEQAQQTKEYTKEVIDAIKLLPDDLREKAGFLLTMKEF